MNLTTMITALKKQLLRLSRMLFLHNKIIFVVVFLSGLVYAMLSLNLILGMASDEDYRTKKLDESRSVRFDKATIDKINQLESGSQQNTTALPTNQRISPFSE